MSVVWFFASALVHRVGRGHGLVWSLLVPCQVINDPMCVNHVIADMTTMCLSFAYSSNRILSLEISYVTSLVRSDHTLSHLCFLCQFSGTAVNIHTFASNIQLSTSHAHALYWLFLYYITIFGKYL